MAYLKFNEPALMSIMIMMITADEEPNSIVTALPTKIENKLFDVYFFIKITTRLVNTFCNVIDKRLIA